MKSDDLRRAIGEIDDDLIENADKKPRSNARRNLKKWGMIAAALLLVVAAIFPLGIRLFKQNTVETFTAGDLMEGIVPRVRSDAPTAVSNDDATAATDFALRLFREAYDGDNTLISPLSAMLALAMAANGAEGETLRQMEAVFGMTRDELNEFFYAFRAGLSQGEKYKLSLADSIWLRDDFKVNQAFLQANADVYGADAYRAPFNETTLKKINDWVCEKTDGMIPELLNEFSPDSVAILINALAFDAEWQYPFASDATASGKFTKENGRTVDVDYMTGTEYGACYLYDDRAQGMFKRYAGGKYAFVALLPNEGISVSEYLASLDGETLRTLLKRRSSPELHVTLPKYDVAYETELSSVLKGMGMTDAFGYDADFSGLGTTVSGDEVYIGRVLQKTFLSLTEKGTRAGAATAVDMWAVAVAPPPVVTLRFDRPFVYMLVDCETDLPLFIGVLNDPS